MPAAMNKQGRRIDPNNELSDLDKAYITITYPPEPSGTNGANWTIEYALNVAGVDDADKRLILGIYATGGEWAELRARFRDWNNRAKGGGSSVLKKAFIFLQSSLGLCQLAM
jgi:hypothetical protein